MPINTHKMGMASITALAIIVTSILISATYLLVVFPKHSLELTLGVFIFGLVLIIQTILILKENSSSLAQASVFVFTYVFLWIAPIIQFTELKTTLVNTTRYDESLFLATNSVCAIFSIFYILGIYYFNKDKHKEDRKPHFVIIKNKKEEPRNIGLIITISVLITLFSIVFSGVLFQDDGAFTPQGLLIRKYLFFIPGAAFIGLLFLYRDGVVSGKKIYFYLLILFVCLLITQNPSTEKRNALGPVYLSVVYIGFGVAMRNRLREISLLIIALLIFFPITAIYTHARNGPGLSFDTNFYALIADHFVATHYDAWANIYATIEFVQDKGLQLGQQIVGAVLFFVPSHIWTGKPQATGILLGNYLIKTHTMWFNNLSSPLISEAFIDFHVFGVALYALILSKIVTFLDKIQLQNKSPLITAMAIYWCFFLVFLLRGSLMIAFAYGLGASAAFLTIYRIAKPKSILSKTSTPKRLKIHTVDLV